MVAYNYHFQVQILLVTTLNIRMQLQVFINLSSKLSNKGAAPLDDNAPLKFELVY